MVPNRWRAEFPGLVAIGAIGLLMSPLLIGWEPVGSDPDQMYRPIKQELARSLRLGRLPLWSDRLGLGVPLLAEGHAAALYPPNWALYAWLDVPTAYRWAMWIHYLALAAATYGYARVLMITPWGGAIAALSFSLCGFQAAHAAHEPLYHVLPYLPLALTLAECYLASGRPAWLALLALTFGAQLTLGHFQIQSWTGGLVLLTGLWRVGFDRRPWPRAVGLVGGLAWGGAIAAVQLAASAELMHAVGQARRPEADLMAFGFPPAHWAELALPRLFRGLWEGPAGGYWHAQRTGAAEACLYVGTIPLILALLGAIAGGRHRTLTPWRWLAPMALIVATLPQWWPAGYSALLRLPVLGHFRAPARYTALTCLGLSLLAGRGSDRTIGARRHRIGLALAVLLGAAAAIWGASWCLRPEFQAQAEEGSLLAALGWGALAWGLALTVVVAWRRRRIGPGGLALTAAVELIALYYSGPTRWGWAAPIPESSPVLRALAREPGVVRVAGFLGNLPVRAGAAPAYPYLGFAGLMPHRLLVRTQSWEWAGEAIATGRLRRLGVTHAAWDGPRDRYLRRDGDRSAGSRYGPFGQEGRTLYRGADAALDRILLPPPAPPGHQVWRVVRLPAPFPMARAVRRLGVVADETELLYRLDSLDPDTAWILAADRPATAPDLGARAARVLQWDGTSGAVAHDGPCALVLTRTYYPGWTARVDGRPARPVLRVDGGLQAILLPGAGLTRVAVRYRPSWLWAASALSIVATGSALTAAAVGSARLLRRGDRRSAPTPDTPARPWP
jgi:hypothetical protein